MGTEPSHGSRILEEVRGHLERSQGLPLDVRAQTEALTQYYVSPKARLLWFQEGRADQLIEVLKKLQDDGLTRTDRWVKRLLFIKQSLRARDTRFEALVEVTFSAALLQIVSDLRLGKFTRYKKLLHERTLARRVVENPALDAVRDGFSINAVLDSVQPTDIDYQAMKSRLSKFVQLRERGGWPLVRVGPKLKLGDHGPDVRDLRQRLAASGELPMSRVSGDRFDKELQTAVKLFQRRHGLATSGLVSRRTQLAMNVPVETRIRQLQVNLERWRWFALPQGQSRWIINTAAQRMFVRDRAGKTRAFRILATHACQDAAAFDTSVASLIYHPEYRLDNEAAARLVLPLLKKNPDMLGERIKLKPHEALRTVPNVVRPDWVDWKAYSQSDFPYDVIIEPGPANPLGTFKFVLGKIDDISVHGQPRKKLPFRQRLSCVALKESGTDFKALVPELERPPSQDEKGEAAPPAPLRIDLPDGASVVFVYATIWLDSGGELVFGPDPLGKDAKLNRFL